MKRSIPDLDLLWHSFRRLSWRWITPPRLDYWTSWVGVTVPFGISLAAVWSRFFRISESWQFALMVLFAWASLAFLFRWITAPRHKENFKNLIVASMVCRTAAFVLVYFTRQGPSRNWDWFFIFIVWCAVTSWFETGYERGVSRLTPSGIGEYEALEGPSLGL